MSTKRFASKIDRWILFVLVFVIAMQFVVIAAVALDTDEDPGVVTSVILICVLAMALIASLLTGTHYTVDRGQLRIVAGPFRWKVPIDEISSVEATRSPLSSPALSLDRLRIRYGKNRKILISPADKTGFLRAIGHELRSQPEPGR